MTLKQAIRAAYSAHKRAQLARRRVRRSTTNSLSVLDSLRRAEEDLAVATAVAIQLVKETA